MASFSDPFPPVNDGEEPSGSSPPPVWDCRWPDPVALRVCSERILREFSPEDPSINPRLGIQVELESGEATHLVTRALLVTPWAVERVYWHNPALGGEPPVRFAVALERDETTGRVAAGQGVLLEVGAGRLAPVVIAWEPETGHTFVETLLHQTQEFDTPRAALAAALGEPEVPGRQSVTSTLNREVSRRGLLGFWRKA